MKSSNKEEADGIMAKIYELKREINFGHLKKEETKTDQRTDEEPNDYKHTDFWWYYDSRKDPWKKGPPAWKMYEDHKSVAIEKKYHEWVNHSDAQNQSLYKRIYVSPDYFIDFAKMI